MQVARSRGAHVIATVRGDAGEARRLGAEEVYDSQAVHAIDALRAAHHDGADAVLDLVSGPDAVRRDAAAVRPGGRLVSTIFAGLTTIGQMLADGTITARTRSAVDLGRHPPLRLYLPLMSRSFAGFQAAWSSAVARAGRKREGRAGRSRSRCHSQTTPWRRGRWPGRRGSRCRPPARGEFDRAGQDGDPACCRAAGGEGDGGEDVDHGGEGRQQVGDRGVAELRRDLHPGPCGGGQRKERVDGDQQPARACPGRVRLRCRGLRRCHGLRHG